MDDRTWKWRGEVVRPDGSRSTLTWTERGYNGSLEKPRKDDLIPEDKIIEAEAPSPAKVRVDLALAAYGLRAADLEFRRAEDAFAQHEKLLLNAFSASEKTEVVVKIDGEHYRFWTNTARVFFRKIEVL
jgi:hypothetical protein